MYLSGFSTHCCMEKTGYRAWRIMRVIAHWQICFLELNNVLQNSSQTVYDLNVVYGVLEMSTNLCLRALLSCTRVPLAHTWLPPRFGSTPAPQPLTVSQARTRDFWGPRWLITSTPSSSPFVVTWPNYHSWHYIIFLGCYLLPASCVPDSS